MALGDKRGPFKLMSRQLVGIGAIQDFLNEEFSLGYEYVGNYNDGNNNWWIFKKVS